MNRDRNTGRNMQDNIRMSGFLEKKGKMKLMSQWKKYWFVLEERLLLYYRSEVEYTNLSPCKGSLNMGLVTTVRPGSSIGPYIIHIIKRTQVIQLRAKNRATQEKWLKALLHSMSLPLVTFKALKPPAKNPSLIGCGSSLDNIALKDKLYAEDLENDWTLPRKLNFSKNGLQISGSFLGGSLDTTIGSEKFDVERTLSSNIPKRKFLEKIVGFAKESDSLANVVVRSKDSRLSFNENKEMKFVGRDLDINGLNEKCKTQKENRVQDLHNSTNNRKKKMNRTLSDTELNKIPSPKFSNSYLSLENIKTERKDRSAIERIKNALSRMPKDNILKGKAVLEKERKPWKKKRHSFLQKVFKKKECQTHDFGSHGTDPLYDTLDHLQEQTQNSKPIEFIIEDNTVTEKENKQDSITGLESLYAEVQKPAVNSKIIDSAKTAAQLKLKLKSRENYDEDDRTEEMVPSLPPRRVSRPISPWHDVPTNNAPIGSDAKFFFVHQAVVKFNNSVPPTEKLDEESDYSDTENDLKLHLIKSRRDSSGFLVQEKKNQDDLSVLLEQLTKITVAPLAEPELTDDNYNSSSESEKWSKSKPAEPDYDIPRSHQHLDISTFEGKEIIPSTEFMGKSDNYSDTGSSVKSIEPDSLEMVEKNFNLIS